MMQRGANSLFYTSQLLSKRQGIYKHSHTNNKQYIIHIYVIVIIVVYFIQIVIAITAALDIAGCLAPAAVAVILFYYCCQY